MACQEKNVLLIKNIFIRVEGKINPIVYQDRIISVSYRSYMNLGDSPQLECWNDGTLE